ncbi:hypothetical protein TWF718_000412 [Orbilia javanica]|uniref:Nucleoside phosphorylase domain-containing protein n=1 Tax=Orbilia javanica TaxID=47235 RepID=A0AAN8RM52_9PEZI
MILDGASKRQSAFLEGSESEVRARRVALHLAYFHRYFASLFSETWRSFVTSWSDAATPEEQVYKTVIELDRERNIALNFESHGQYNEAIRRLTVIFNVCQKFFGSGHPSRLSTICNIAGVLKKQGKYGEAIGWYKRVLVECEKSLRKDSQWASETEHELDTDSGYAFRLHHHAREDVDQFSTAPTHLKDDMEPDRDDKTVYSETSSIPPLEKEGYMSQLAEILYNDVCPDLHGSRTSARVLAILPELLKAFALKLGHNTPSHMHRDAMVFVHKHRGDIVEIFKEKHFGKAPESPPDPRLIDSDQLSLEERISLLYRDTEDPPVPHEGPPRTDAEHTYSDVDPDECKRLRICEINTLDMDTHSNTALDQLKKTQDHETSVPQTDSFIDFMVRAPAYRWLVERLRRETILFPVEPNHMLDVRERILESLPASRRISKKRSSKSFNITFVLDWNPWDFVMTRGYSKGAGDAVERAITLTGSLADSQALTCAEYLRQTWPFGEKTIELIKSVSKSSSGTIQTCGLPDKTKIRARARGWGLVVEAIGTRDSIAEIGEQLTWLGAALYPSTFQFGPAYSMASLRARNVANLTIGTEPWEDIIFDIGYRVDKKERTPPHVIGQCWHGMFRNPVVVKGYPILQRASNRPNLGLEISLEMMAGLVKTKYIHTFDEKIYLKGFSSMLVAMEKEDDKFIWHLLYNESGDHISYLEGRGTSAHVPYIHIPELNAARHFVGWSSKTKYNAGSATADYNVQSSGLRNPHEGCALENTRLRPGLQIQGDSQLAISWRDRPASVTRGSHFERIRWIHEKYVILWDKKDMRGWLVNGTSALLHLLRRSLVQMSRGNFKKIYKEDGNSTRVRDLLHTIYNMLEQVMDYQIDVVDGNRDLSQRARRYLEGWDFNDLARVRDPTESRMTILPSIGKGWVDFTRDIYAVTLFGSGFGEIFEPIDGVSCALWAKLPKNSYYLAASIRDLKEIIGFDTDEGSTPIQLSKKMNWHYIDVCNRRCGQGGGREEHLDLVQVLLPSKFWNTSAGSKCVELKDEGAVIFGHNKDFGWVWKDTGDPEECEPNSLSEEPEIWPLDSGIGSSLSSFDKDPARDDYKIGVVCALSKELKAVRALFERSYDDLKNIPRDPNHYALGCISQCNVVTTCLPAGAYGTNSANLVVSHLIRSFRNIQTCFLVGIGGGVPSDKNDIRLGDVVVSIPTGIYPGVIQHDSGKTLPGDKFERTGCLLPPPISLLTAINILRSNPELPAEPLREYIKRIAEAGSEYQHPGAQDLLFGTDNIHTEGQETCIRCENPILREERESGNYPRIHYGLIASGNQVVKDSKARDKLAAEGALCVEMEAAGVTNQIPCLVIRGICDYADSHKNKIWQEYACATAAAYLGLLLTVFNKSDDLAGTLDEPLRTESSRKRASSPRLDLLGRKSKKGKERSTS